MRPGAPSSMEEEPAVPCRRNRAGPTAIHSPTSRPASSALRHAEQLPARGAPVSSGIIRCVVGRMPHPSSCTRVHEYALADRVDEETVAVPLGERQMRPRRNLASANDRLTLVVPLFFLLCGQNRFRRPAPGRIARGGCHEPGFEHLHEGIQGTGMTRVSEAVRERRGGNPGPLERIALLAKSTL